MSHTVKKKVQFGIQVIVLFLNGYFAKNIPSQRCHDPKLPESTFHATRPRLRSQTFGSKLDSSSHSKPDEAHKELVLALFLSFITSLEKLYVVSHCFFQVEKLNIIRGHLFHKGAEIQISP